MVEIVCAKCGKPFLAKQRNARFCGQNCQMRAWRHKNLEHSRAYMRAWASKNPEALARHNENRRKGWETVPCKKCGALFQKTGGASLYCSPKCRGQARRSRMTVEDRVIERARGRKWTNENRDYVRQIARNHYHRHAVENLRAQPWVTLLNGRSRDAKKKQIPFELTDEWARARWKGCCELTGMPFAPPEKRVGYKNRNFSPSIDKIIPALGYTQDNSRFVLWAINSLKRDGTNEQMYAIAEALVRHRHIKDIAGILSLPG